MNCLKCRLEIASDTPEHYGLHLLCFEEWFKVTTAVEFDSLNRKASSSDEEKEYSSQNTSFFHGKFKKYSADLDGGAYIIKMRQGDAVELPEVEYLCNQIAKLVGVPVAEFFYINFYGDNTFVTKNFIMPALTPKDLQHIYHFRPDGQHSCAEIINVIAKETQRPYDVAILIRTILFDALIGNHDRHGRNLALIVKANECVLSPIYDNVSYLALESGWMLKAHHNPTGKICTSTTFEPSMRDYAIEFKKLGYEDEVKRFFKSIKIDEISKLIFESFCSDSMKEAIDRLVKNRYEELKNEL